MDVGTIPHIGRARTGEQGLKHPCAPKKPGAGRIGNAIVKYC